MKLVRLEIEGFKSFKEYQEFSFDRDNGLYFVTGDNKLEPNLGANGAGKSALFEAICWCLYGKTSTNIKANNIVNWDDKTCSVALTFDNDLIIQRDQNPNKLTINDNPVTQEELEKELGYIGFESFLYSTFISQFSSKFFDLSPADKMAVFSDIMAETLYPWELRSIQAKTRSEKIGVIIKDLEKEISKLNGALGHSNSIDYSQQIKGFEDRKKEALKEANDNLKILTENYRTSKSALAGCMKDKAKLEMESNKIKVPERGGGVDNIHSKYNEIFFQIESELSKVKDYKNKVTEKIFLNKAEYSTLQKEKEKLEGVSGISTCPTCLQKVDKKLLKDKSAEIQKKLLSLEKELSKLKDVLANWDNSSADFKKQLAVENENKEKELAKLHKKIDKESKEKGELLVQIRVLSTTIDGLSKSIADFESRISQLKTNIQNIESTKNEYLELEEKRQADIKSFTDAIKDNEGLLGVAKREFDAFVYWVKGFKEIRLLLMLDALKELEISINNNLSKFGLADWSITLDIDKSNKDGSIRKGFSVLINSPDKIDTPLDTFSGGERQRLVLAGSIGLMDLIQSKRQVDFGIEIFDEASAWLSENGISDLVDILFQRSKENEKKLFLIDHKNLGSYGMFTGTINIVKDENGSHIFS